MIRLYYAHEPSKDQSLTAECVIRLYYAHEPSKDQSLAAECVTTVYVAQGKRDDVDGTTSALSRTEKSGDDKECNFYIIITQPIHIPKGGKRWNGLELKRAHLCHTL